jgi:hypothetical protein
VGAAVERARIRGLVLSTVRAFLRSQEQRRGWAPLSLDADEPYLIETVLQLWKIWNVDRAGLLDQAGPPPLPAGVSRPASQRPTRPAPPPDGWDDGEVTPLLEGYPEPALTGDIRRLLDGPSQTGRTLSSHPPPPPVQPLPSPWPRPPGQRPPVKLPPPPRKR